MHLNSYIYIYTYLYIYLHTSIRFPYVVMCVNVSLSYAKENFLNWLYPKCLLFLFSFLGKREKKMLVEKWKSYCRLHCVHTMFMVNGEKRWILLTQPIWNLFRKNKLKKENHVELVFLLEFCCCVKYNVHCTGCWRLKRESVSLRIITMEPKTWPEYYDSEKWLPPESI